MGLLPWSLRVRCVRIQVAAALSRVYVTAAHAHTAQCRQLAHLLPKGRLQSDNKKQLDGVCRGVSTATIQGALRRVLHALPHTTVTVDSMGAAFDGARPAPFSRVVHFPSAAPVPVVPSSSPPDPSFFLFPPD